jgi:hypothetical protein
MIICGCFFVNSKSRVVVPSLEPQTKVAYLLKR